MRHFREVNEVSPPHESISVNGTDTEDFLTKDIYDVGTILDVVLRRFDIKFDIPAYVKKNCRYKTRRRVGSWTSSK